MVHFMIFTAAATALANGTPPQEGVDSSPARPHTSCSELCPLCSLLGSSGAGDPGAGPESEALYWGTVSLGIRQAHVSPTQHRPGPNRSLPEGQGLTAAAGSVGLLRVDPFSAELAGPSLF